MKAFIVDKEELKSIHINSSTINQIDDGEVLFEIKTGAFTSNNITYAVLGKKFKYWNFFPHQKGGIIPVWGFAIVIESRINDIKVGDEYFGYYPMATHLIVKPKKISKYGMVDRKEHRSDLPGVYNYYERIGAEYLKGFSVKNAYMIFQPLFATSFLLEDFYKENDCFGAKEIYVTSASSKTAIAFAYMLQKNSNNISIIGITSKSNVEFCKKVDCYDQVFDYSQITEIKAGDSSVVDFAGNRSVLDRLQRVLFNSLKKCTTVGFSHWDKGKSETKLLVKNDLFFAPNHAKKRQAEWGGKVFKLKLDEALFPFINWSLKWMTLETIHFDEIKNTYRKVLEGDISPESGLIFNFNE